LFRKAVTCCDVSQAELYCSPSLDLTACIRLVAPVMAGGNCTGIVDFNDSASNQVATSHFA
jgi:hypothetical protein